MKIGIIGLKGQQVAHLQNEFPGRDLQFLPENKHRTSMVRSFMHGLDIVLIIKKSTPSNVIDAIPRTMSVMMPGNVSVSSVARWLENKFEDLDEAREQARLKALEKEKEKEAAKPTPAPAPAAVTPPEHKPEDKLIEIRAAASGLYDYSLVKAVQLGDRFRVMRDPAMDHQQFLSRVGAARVVLKEMGFKAFATYHDEYAEMLVVRPEDFHRGKVIENAAPAIADTTASETTSAPAPTPEPASAPESAPEPEVGPTTTWDEVIEGWKAEDEAKAATPTDDAPSLAPNVEYCEERGGWYPRIPNPMYDYSPEALAANGYFKREAASVNGEPTKMASAVSRSALRDDPPMDPPAPAVPRVLQTPPPPRSRFMDGTRELWRHVLVARLLPDVTMEEAVAEADRAAELYRSRFN